MNIKERVGIAISHASRGGYKDGLVPESVQPLGASMWNKLTGYQKSNYLKSSMPMLEDDPDYDPHIFMDDPGFQKAIIDNVLLFIQQAEGHLTSNYLESNAGWPKDLTDTINKNKGGYTYSELLKSLSLYQNNPKIELSRGRRYKGKDVKRVPVSMRAKYDAYRNYDQIGYGLELLMSMPDDQQDAIIRSVLPKNTQGGYPAFMPQNSENMVDLTEQLCKRINYPMFKSVKMVDDKGNKIEKMFFTVKWILDLVYFCHEHELYFPFILFARSHFDKVRDVFGGNWLFKLLGCVFVAAKHLGYTKDIAIRNKIPVNEDKYDLPNTPIVKIYSRNNIPYISQLNWDIQFEIYRDKLPPVDGKVNSAWIFEKFNLRLPDGDYILNVLGDDYSKFDTTVVPEDFEWLHNHKVWGKLFSYVMDSLKNNQVWIGGYRIGDIVYASGHPFTANWGTDIHHNRNCVAVAKTNARRGGKVVEIAKANIKSTIKLKTVCDVLYENEKFYAYYYATVNPCILVGDTNQSDDSIIFAIGLHLKEMEEILAEYGLIIKADASSDFLKYKYVTFLQMHIGWVLKNRDHPVVLGNPISKYLGLAHSEREIDEEKSGSLNGVFKITEDVNINAFFSKIGSVGKDGEDVFIRPVCLIVKNTISGAKSIRAMAEIDPSRSYELYRSDVMFGMNPSFLGSIDIRDYLVNDVLRKGVETV